MIDLELHHLALGQRTETVRLDRALVAEDVFSAVLLRWLGAGWGSALVIGLASAAISYYLFGVVLSVPLPRGILFD